jgi:hypothetical protein
MCSLSPCPAAGTPARLSVAMVGRRAQAAADLPAAADHTGITRWLVQARFS